MDEAAPDAVIELAQAKADLMTLDELVDVDVAEAHALCANRLAIEVEKVEQLRAERDAALAAIERVRATHRRYTYYELEDSCPDTSDEHREEHHHEASDDIGEFYCDQMPTGDVVCDNCRDVNGDRMDWPCLTAVSIWAHHSWAAAETGMAT